MLFDRLLFNVKYTIRIEKFLHSPSNSPQFIYLSEVRAIKHKNNYGYFISSAIDQRHHV
jgi:hypothetical protein